MVVTRAGGSGSRKRDVSHGARACAAPDWTRTYLWTINVWLIDNVDEQIKWKQDSIMVNLEPHKLSIYSNHNEFTAIGGVKEKSKVDIKGLV